MTDPAPCPICAAPAAPGHMPFCSRGCRDRDLLNWFGEDYRIAARAEHADGLDSPADPD